MVFRSKTPKLRRGDVVAGRFRIVEPIGSGGFSVVYRAHQESMNRFVALKVLKPSASSDKKTVERFRREALYASHLSHPNTITLFDYGHTDEGLCYIAMEYLQGIDLADCVHKGEPMALERVWKILTQTCRSLAEAHQLGLVHRDLKPENIFLVQRDRDELVKVLDFGVSKAISDFADAGPRAMAPLTQEGTVFGTPLYMAPEQAMAESITPAVDVYALGHIAYEMITGRAAYADFTNAMDVMLHQINDPPLALPEPWADTPFAPVIEKCTQKKPAKRIRDASGLLRLLLDDAFEPYMDEAQRSQRSPTTLPEMPSVTDPEDYTMPPEVDAEVAEAYQDEYNLLQRVWAQVRHEGVPRLVIMRGKPGTGRSNLLRAFLGSHRDAAGTMIAHRQTSGADHTRDAGLEADLACLTADAPRGQGIDELNRLLRHYESKHTFDVGGARQPQSDAAPITDLSAQRDAFLARLSVPFRHAARSHDGLIWALENLERIDNMTLAFLDRFFRDLQTHPAPIMIVATVYPDDLMKRPGLLRYTQGLLQATRPVAYQLHLIPPSKSAHRGSPQQTSFRSQPVDTADTVPNTETGPMNLFDSFEDEPLESAEPRSEADIAFDTVLGHLAQLGDRVPEDLWKLAQARVLPAVFTGLADFIVQQAERFGILQRQKQVIAFAKPGYAEHLRQSLGSEEELVDTRAAIADLMIDSLAQPTREQRRTIAEHLRAARQPWRAMELLQEAGERAWRGFDLDAAREYYILVRKLLEGVHRGVVVSQEPPVARANVDEARIWVRLGEIHGALGEHGAAEDALSRALDARAAPEVHGRAHKILGDLAVSQNRYTSAKNSYREARDCFRQAGHAGAFVAAMGAMGHCALMQGANAEAEEILRVALDKAGQLQNDILVARLGRFMGQVLTQQGHYMRAITHLERSLGLFEGVGHDKETLACLVELGEASYASMRFEAARDHLRRAVAMPSTLHVAASRPPQLDMARSLSALSALAEAQTHLRTAVDQCRSANDRLRLARVHFYAGDIALARGDFAAAREQFQQVDEIARAVGHTELWFDSQIRLAYVAFDAGEAERAYGALASTMEMAQEIGDHDQELSVRAHIIYLQLLEHDFGAPGDTFGTLLENSEALDVERAAVLCKLFKADVMAARGEITHSRELLAGAREAAAQLGDHALFIHIARRHFLLARRQGEPADAQLGAGFAVGGLVPPETAKRRFNEGRIGN